MHVPTHIRTAIQAYAVMQLRFSSPQKHRSRNLCDGGLLGRQVQDPDWTAPGPEVGWRLSSNQKLGESIFWCQVSAGKGHTSQMFRKPEA